MNKPIGIFATIRTQDHKTISDLDIMDLYLNKFLIYFHVLHLAAREMFKSEPWSNYTLFQVLLQYG